MTPREEAQSFLDSGVSMEKYHQAVSFLREIGFEKVLRRLGEPAELLLDQPNRLEVAAFDQAEKIGWFRCLDFVFNFDGAFGEVTQPLASPDFGADAILEEWSKR